MNLEILKSEVDKIVYDLEIVKPYLDHEHMYNQALNDMSIHVKRLLERVTMIDPDKPCVLILKHDEYLNQEQIKRIYDVLKKRVPKWTGLVLDGGLDYDIVYSDREILINVEKS